MVQNKTAWKHGAARAVKAIFAVLGALTIVFFAFFGGEFSEIDPAHSQPYIPS